MLLAVQTLCGCISKGALRALRPLAPARPRAFFAVVSGAMCLANPSVSQDIVLDTVTFNVTPSGYIMGHHLGGEVVQQYLLELNTGREPRFALLNCFPRQSECLGGSFELSAAREEEMTIFRIVIAPDFDHPDYAMVSERRMTDGRRVRVQPERIMKIIYWETGRLTIPRPGHN